MRVGPYVFLASLLALFAAGGRSPLAAHPHMSLESSVEFVFDGESAAGFWLEWTFDPYFSAAIIQEHDRNRDRRFDAAEAKAVHDGAFINLRKYRYFIYLRSGSERVNPEKVEQFTPSVKGDRLVYRFYVNLAGKGYGRDFSVAIFDSTYFCAVTYAPVAAAVRQLGASSPVPSWEKSVNRKFPVYYDPMAPATDNTVHRAWRPGLETAYPEEIRVYF